MRFRVLRIIALLGLAFSAAPTAALRALIDLLQGKSVRGRNGIHRAAAFNRFYYKAWTRLSEADAVGQWSAEQKPVHHTAPLRIGLVPLGPGMSEVLPAVQASLPTRAVRIAHGSVAEVLDQCLQSGCDWLMPVAPGTCMSRHAADVLAVAAAESQAEVIYWDHDFVRGSKRHDPVLKPSWDGLVQASVDLLYGTAMVRCDAVRRHFPELAELPISRLAAGLAAASIVAPLHIPLILTHLPVAAAAAAVPGAEARRVAVSALPGVSILIPTRDRADLLRVCLTGLERLRYSAPVEIIVIDNDSSDPATLAMLDDLAVAGSAKVIRHPGEFNFAAMINHGAALAGHKVLCLLNNDVEPLDGEWLSWMVAQALQPRSGAIGARLLYPDGTVQHAGIAIGIGGAAGHVAKGTPQHYRQHRLWHAVSRRVSAVTAACLVVERAKFDAVGGMDHEVFAIDFNDVDLCLRLQQAGLENYIVAEATLIHAESKSRGTQRTGKAQERFEHELAALRARWRTIGYRDPWFHPLFRIESQECLLRF